MKIKGYLYVPEDEASNPDMIIFWLRSSEEQGGYYETLEEAKKDKKNRSAKFVIVPIEFSIGSPIEE